MASHDLRAVGEGASGESVTAPSPPPSPPMGEMGSCSDYAGAPRQRVISRRKRAVPRPHSPLTIGPIRIRGKLKIAATEPPFSGVTMNQATRVGKIAPNTIAPTQ